MYSYLPEALSLDLMRFFDEDVRIYLILDNFTQKNGFWVKNLFRKTKDYLCWIVFSFELITSIGEIQNFKLKEALSEKDIKDLLNLEGIVDKNIQTEIINKSRGYLGYLEIAIIYFHQYNNKTSLVFPLFFDDLIQVFMKNIENTELRSTLEVLSIPKYWNREIFDLVCKEISFLPITEFNNFLNLPLIERTHSEWYSLMIKFREFNICRIESEDEDLFKRIHSRFLEYFDNNLDPENSSYTFHLECKYYHLKNIDYPNAIDDFESIAFDLLNKGYNRALLRITEELHSNDATPSQKIVLLNYKMHSLIILGELEVAEKTILCNLRVYEELIEEGRAKIIEIDPLKVKSPKIITPESINIQEMYIDRIATPLLKLIDIYIRTGRIEKAESLLNNLENSLNSFFYKDILKYCIYERFHDLSKGKKAEEYLCKAEEAFDDIIRNDDNKFIKVIEGKLFLRKGMLSLNKRKYDDAYKHAKRADKALLQTGYEGGILRLYNLYGLIYTHQNEFNKAEDYYGKVLGSKMLSQDLHLKIRVFKNYGSFLVKNDRILEAIDFFHNALIDAFSIKDIEMINSLVFDFALIKTDTLKKNGDFWDKLEKSFSKVEKIILSTIVEIASFDPVVHLSFLKKHIEIIKKTGDVNKANEYHKEMLLLQSAYHEELQEIEVRKP